MNKFNADPNRPKREKTEKPKRDKKDSAKAEQAEDKSSDGQSSGDDGLKLQDNKTDNEKV